MQNQPSHMETTVKTYTSSGEMEKDQKKMAKQGWTVQQTGSNQPRSGIARNVLLGPIGAIAFKPRSQIIVTYQRPAAAPQEAMPAGLSFQEQIRWHQEHPKPKR